MSKTTFDQMRARIHARAGISDDVCHDDLVSLSRSEWSTDFETLMRNRLIIGAMRYGKLKAPNKPQWDRVAGARKRLDEYEKTGNLESLVDVANLMLIEFVEGKHPLKHFSVNVDGNHCCM